MKKDNKKINPAANGVVHAEVKWWQPIVHFATHVFVGSVIFVMMIATTLALGWMVEHLKDWGASAFTVTVFESVEHCMLIVDAMSFVWYILHTAYKAVKEN